MASAGREVVGFEVVNLDDFTVDPGEMDTLAGVYGLYAEYSRYKATSMRLRRGNGLWEDINACEKAMERVYQRLPAWAKW